MTYMGRMIMIKSLSDLAWNVSESEYRASPAISYSTLSRFDREGFKKIPEIGDKMDTPSLRYGGLLDCILTDYDSIDERFYFTDVKRPSETIARMVESLYVKEGKKYQDIKEIPTDTVIETLNSFNYYANYGEAKRINLLLTGGEDYYRFLGESKDKVIMSEEEFTQAKANANMLRTHPYTSKYFFKNRLDKSIENLDQLKFKIAYDKTGLRCMFDKIIVDHQNKKIQPCDLKFTSKDEHLFEQSFLEYRYYLQGTLYTFILREVISGDDYFKDFEILPYHFIVINRYNNLPIVWEFDSNKWEGDFQNIYGTKYKGWKTLYEELTYYLNRRDFNYSREAVENKGILKIRGIHPLQ